MITKEWVLSNKATVILEIDPQPIMGCDKMYRLRYEDGNVQDAILDYNFSATENFERRMMHASLMDYRIDFHSIHELHSIVDEANVLVELAR